MAVLLLEAALAVLVWMPRLQWAALLTAGALHTGFVLGGGATSFARIGLVVFSVLCLGLIAHVARQPLAEARDAAVQHG